MDRARMWTLSAIVAAATCVALPGLVTAQEGSVERSRRGAETMKIRITVAAGRSVTATLAPNATARDFASLLPLSLTLKDYASTEKVADLPRRLTTDGAPDGFDPSAGDVAYYAPWGNLAIFYKDFQYSPGLVRLGVLEGGVETLTASDSVSITIERAE